MFDKSTSNLHLSLNLNESAYDNKNTSGNLKILNDSVIREVREALETNPNVNNSNYLNQLTSTSKDNYNPHGEELNNSGHFFLKVFEFQKNLIDLASQYDMFLFERLELHSFA